MPWHKNLDFPELHRAVFEAGTAAARPFSPDGVGDIYYATDRKILYVANAAGTAWESFNLGDDLPLIITMLEIF